MGIVAGCRLGRQCPRRCRPQLTSTATRSLNQTRPPAAGSRPDVRLRPPVLDSRRRGPRHSPRSVPKPSLERRVERTAVASGVQRPGGMPTTGTARGWRARHERPSSRRAAEQRDELAPLSADRIASVAPRQEEVRSITHCRGSVRGSLRCGSPTRLMSAMVVRHEDRRSKRRCATVREMKEGPSRPAVRFRPQTAASCCRQKRWW